MFNEEATAKIVDRIWKKDASLWAPDEASFDLIENRLGWLTLPVWLRANLSDLRSRTQQLSKNGWQRIVLLGMGGSSLAATVLKECSIDSRVPFQILDSTHPENVRKISEQQNLGKTLFLVSSKSGTTLETIKLWSHFYGLIRAENSARDCCAGDNFVAITDNGTPLQNLAIEKKFLDCFINPTDVGGRFSALTYSGMLPAALLGLEVESFLESAEREASRCRSPMLDENAGLALGLGIGEQMRAGKNKLTLLLPDQFLSLGDWIEQLVAESSGKAGQGLVPIVNEPWLHPSMYHEDRLFIAVLGSRDKSLRSQCDLLESVGFPVFRSGIDDITGLGGQFFRWEFAVAVACAVIGINPFDEPDVYRSKDETTRALTDMNSATELASTQVIGLGVTDNCFQISMAEDSVDIITSKLRDFFLRANESNYIAILAWVEDDKEYTVALEKLQATLRKAYSVPVVVNFGPRYLHSTGQLHKGGPPTGIFLQLVGSTSSHISIPGSNKTFSDLYEAQAAADFKVLCATGRPVARVKLLKDPHDDASDALGRLTDICRMIELEI
ncbi:MAG: hypothetical protein CL398_06585 [Acidiferrobacteraceae bacterium]|nr:hypothetical protein [Acidiferrobacteraceae bacterium]